MRFRHIAVGILTLVLAIAAGPWLLYWYALGQLDGLPQAPRYHASAAEIQGVWNRAHGAGKPTMHPISPYDYVGALFAGVEKSRRPEWNIIGHVAARHNTVHLPTTGLWGHLSGAATEIWISRSWTAEQIFSQAVEDARRGAVQE
ncbi:MAG: hypothetical protein JO142_10950 [Burkholderiales bacterium]|nr:hypothetical protein [Burkholderiales bacterium]